MKKQLLFISLIANLILISVIFYFKNWSQQNSINNPPIDQEKTTENSLCLIEIPERDKEQKYETLNKLSTEVQVDYFVRLLGCPVFVNDVAEEPYKEYVFVDKDYFVQAISDLDGKIVSYAVTSRSKDFNPTFEMSGLIKVTLNKTPFYNWITISNQDEYPPQLWCYQFLGAHDPLYYFEQTFFGNAGHYLNFLVGVNNSAYFDDLPEIIIYNFSDERVALSMTYGRVDCNRVKLEERKRLTPNTFIVRAPFFDVNEDKLPSVWFGVKNVQVRLLPDGL